MTYKLSWIQREEAEHIMESSKMNYLTKFGEYNFMPEPFVEVDFDEFMNFNDTYSPIITDFRQIIMPGDKYYMGYKLYFFQDRGYAFTRINKGVYKAYRLGCLHAYSGMTPQECYDAGIEPPSMCWHVDKCTKCGMIRTTDSSD